MPGHLEGDHIKGSSNRSQVGTLVEGKTRYVALIQLKEDATTKGFGTILQCFEVDQRKLLTDDQVEK